MQIVADMFHNMTIRDIVDGVIVLFFAFIVIGLAYLQRQVKRGK